MNDNRHDKLEVEHWPSRIGTPPYQPERHNTSKGRTVWFDLSPFEPTFFQVS
ncbi:Signal peptidase I [Anopheles sinensis]|uniref:Signal peptidase I n=1 Tax=Anopheles sinensis TaxID=74873 RepID=A0A084WE49_ANOSI|nr:Signal peptidase I [Anopheles sinensis]